MCYFFCLKNLEFNLQLLWENTIGSFDKKQQNIQVVHGNVQLLESLIFSYPLYPMKTVIYHFFVNDLRQPLY
jgi:hypothetical protein